MKKEKCIILILSIILAVSVSFNAYLVWRNDQVTWKYHTLPDLLKKSIVEYHDWDSFVELIEYGIDDSIIYAMFLSDMDNNIDACYQSYTLVLDFYNNLGMELPQNAFNMVFPYLKRAAEANDELALMEIADIYEEGKYLPKDSKLAEEYSKRRMKHGKQYMRPKVQLTTISQEYDRN